METGNGRTRETAQPPAPKPFDPSASADGSPRGCNALVLLDAEGRLISADPAFLTMWRLDEAGTVIGRGFADFCAAPRGIEPMMSVTADQPRWQGELTGRRADGSVFPLRVSVVHLSADPGAPRLAVSLLDESGLSDLVRERDCYRQMAETFFRHNPDPTYILDGQGTICDLNDAALSERGLAREQLLGRNVRESDDPESASKVPERLARILAGESLKFQVTHLTKHGNQIPLEIFATPFDYFGQTRIFNISRDISARLAAEKILRQESERPRLALASANQGLYDLNVQSGECVVSDEYARMLGYDPESFVETNAAWIERLHPDDREPVAQVYRDYVGGKVRDYRVEFRQRTADGRWLWILSIGKVVEWDGAGRPLRMIGTHTDISEMKAAQEILRKNAERPRLALASTNQGYFDCNIQTGDALVSKEYAQMLGFEPDELTNIHTAYYDRLHPDDRAAAEQRIQDYMKKRTPHIHSEFRMRRRDGRWIWVFALASVIEHDEQGRPLRLTGTHTDITEFKTQQDQTRHLAELPIFALAANKQGLFDSNLQTGETHVSEGFAHMLGFEPHEMRDVNTAWLNRLHPDDRGPAQQRVEAFLDGRLDAYRSEFRMSTKDGQWKWILSMATILDRDKQGKPLRMVGTHTDITEMKAEQEELARRQQQQMQVERLSLANGLASVVAHELNQPLCAITNHLAAVRHALNDLGLDTHGIREDTKYASDAAHRAATIIRRFRDLFTKLRPNAHRASPVALVRDSIEMLHADLTSAQVRLEQRLDQRTPEILADPTLIHQVLLNLAQNAIEAMSQVEGRQHVLSFSLTASECGRWAQLHVTDTGPGFPAEVRANLFEAKRSTKSHGLGMGLCICRLIVRSHGGDIRLLRTGEQGSCLELRLPAASEIDGNELANGLFTDSYLDQGLLT